MSRVKSERWRGVCRCGGEAEHQARFDERYDEMYHRYKCKKCGAFTLAHLTRWEAQAEWEARNATAGS